MQLVVVDSVSGCGCGYLLAARRVACLVKAMIVKSVTQQGARKSKCNLRQLSPITERS